MSAQRDSHLRAQDGVLTRVGQLHRLVQRRAYRLPASEHVQTIVQPQQDSRPGQSGQEAAPAQGALRECRRLLEGSGLPVSLLAADLDYFYPHPESYDLILVIRYLNRPLIPRLKRALRPAGVMLYATFNTNYLVEKPGFNRQFTLEPGELSATFADFQVCASNDTQANQELTSYWIGRKPG